MSVVVRHSNVNLNVEYLSASQLRMEQSSMRRISRPLKNSTNALSTSLPFPTTSFSLPTLSLTKNGKKRGRPFKNQSLNQLVTHTMIRPVNKKAKVFTGRKLSPDPLQSTPMRKIGRPFMNSSLNMSNRSTDISTSFNQSSITDIRSLGSILDRSKISSELSTSLLSTVHFYDGQKQPVQNAKDDKTVNRTLVIDGELIEVLYSNESDTDDDQMDEQNASSCCSTSGVSSNDKQIQFVFGDGIKIIETIKTSEQPTAMISPLTPDLSEEEMITECKSPEINVTDVLENEECNAIQLKNLKDSPPNDTNSSDFNVSVQVDEEIDVVDVCRDNLSSNDFMNTNEDCIIIN